MERRGEDRRRGGGGYYRRLQEVGPYTGGNVNRCLKVRPVQETEGEACTEGGASTGVERRGLYRRWCEACTGGGKESLLPVLLKNDKLDRRRTYRRISE
jgi:hypothetical protein